jgi:hypothetical protein
VSDALKISISFSRMKPHLTQREIQHNLDNEINEGEVVHAKYMGE